MGGVAGRKPVAGTKWTRYGGGMLVAPSKPSLQVASAVLCIAALSGCAAETGFPTLAPRPIEQAAEAVMPAEAATVAADPALAARLAAIGAAADAGEADFAKEMSSVGGALQAAAGASPGSDPWVAGQQMLSRLEAARTPMTTALADLDALARERPSNPQDAAAVAALAARIGALAAGQEQAVAAWTTRLSPR